MSQEYDLVGRVIGCAMTVHRALGAGFLEVIYRNALCLELRQYGIAYTVEEPIRVKYRGVEVGSYMADVLVEGQVIVELKPVDKLSTTHKVQLVNYLTATNIESGLLLNFGAKSLDYRRKVKTLPPRPAVPQS